MPFMLTDNIVINGTVIIIMMNQVLTFLVTTFLEQSRFSDRARNQAIWRTSCAVQILDVLAPEHSCIDIFSRKPVYSSEQYTIYKLIITHLLQLSSHT